MRGRRAATLTTTLLAIAGVGLLAVRYAGTGEGPAQHSRHASVDGVARVGGPFRLTTHEGVDVTAENYRGRPFVIVFGHSGSADVTPAMLQSLSAALDTVPGSAAIQPLFVTLDPDRDGVEVLKAYVPRFHPRLVGLTGAIAEIDAVARAYHVNRRVVPAADGNAGGELDFAPIYYVMNENGALFRAVEAPASMHEVADALRAVLHMRKN